MRIVGERPEQKWLPTSSLRVDVRYQRDLESGQVAIINKILDEFDWEQFTAPNVAERTDGTFYVYDGQTRVVAVQKRGDIKSIPCLVSKHNGATAGNVEKESIKEADVCRAINQNTKPWTKLNHFKAAIHAQDPVAVGINKIVNKSGFKVCGGGGSRNVGCVALLQKEFKDDPGRFEVVWNIVAAIYQNHPKSVRGPLMKGVFFLYEHFDQNSSSPALTNRNVDKLVTAGVPEIEKLIKAAADFHNNGKVNQRAAAAGILQVINKGLRADRQYYLDEK